MTQNKLLKTLLAQAAGSIDFPFTNDYMFRACLQDSKKSLKALVASLLHLHIRDILELTVTNPIELGAAIDNKDFILDIRLLLNGCQLVNLEMQVSNEYNWPERSISYTARTYDQLKSGENYHNVLPVINIGFLNYTLFPDAPEFYSRNLLTNVKNHHIYSDKFDVRVVDLTCIDLATADDKAYYIDRWAQLFKATSWEEIRMIAQDNPYLTDAAETIFKMNADDMVRQRCLARMDYERHQALQKQKMEELQAQLAESKEIIAKNQSELAESKEIIAKSQSELAESKEIIAALQAQIKDLEKKK